MTAVDRREEVLTHALVARYAATFDREGPHTAQLGLHWCLCTPEAATRTLGADGHPERGDTIMPPGPLSRRMWASSDVRWFNPIQVGAGIVRNSRVADTRETIGASGPLQFVTLAHEIAADGVPAITETQTIVYRSAGGTHPAPPVPSDDDAWDWHRTITPDAMLLFRYSALTFNSHRIHYDLRYATEAEGYPGLVVQGPLMASLLLDLVDRQLGPDALARFAFRAVAPAFANAPITLLGRRRGAEVDLRVRSAAGYEHLAATAHLRESG